MLEHFQEGVFVDRRNVVFLGDRSLGPWLRADNDECARVMRDWDVRLDAAPERLNHRLCLRSTDAHEASCEYESSAGERLCRDFRELKLVRQPRIRLLAADAPANCPDTSRNQVVGCPRDQDGEHEKGKRAKEIHFSVRAYEIGEQRRRGAAREYCVSRVGFPWDVAGVLFDALVNELHEVFRSNNLAIVCDGGGDAVHAESPHFFSGVAEGFEDVVFPEFPYFHDRDASACGVTFCIAVFDHSVERGCQPANYITHCFEPEKRPLYRLVAAILESRAPCVESLSTRKSLCLFEPDPQLRASALSKCAEGIDLRPDDFFPAVNQKDVA